jgi:hypothetical protein
MAAQEKTEPSGEENSFFSPEGHVKHRISDLFAGAMHRKHGQLL